MDRALITKADVPDCVWPTNNGLDVPTLDGSLQAGYGDFPLIKWGFGRRSARVEGCYHFYTDDYKFSALWGDPSPVVRSGCSAIVEPNYSTNEQMPAAIALYHIYRKRWLARYWQSLGIRTWVDMCVAVRFQCTNLLGIPAGWGSYMTRAYGEQIGTLEQELALAEERCGENELRFVVYGGGKLVRRWCEIKGLLHVPETMHVFDGRLTRATA